MVPTPRSRRISPTTKDATLTSRHLDKGVARYYRLYELLSAALQDGSIAPDSALPSEPELCARHGLSRTTVRRALDRLEREGRIIRRRGSGTYARTQRVRARICLELHALSETLADLESRTTATTLRFDAAVPVPQILRAIASELGSTAYLLERLLSNHGEPLSLTAAYLPEPIGRRLKRPARNQTSLTTILARGRPATAIKCSVGAVAADADAARALRVSLGSPLLRVRSVLVDEDGKLRAVLESLCRSDRLQLKVVEPQRRHPG